MNGLGKILIVDDHAEMQAMMLRFLEPLGHAVSSALDGQQAMRLLESEDFNVVLLDLMLPDISGMDIFKYIREVRPETEVIVLTAFASIESAVEALRLGAYDYITKPCRAAAIRSVVGRAFEKQHLLARLAAIHDLSRELALSLDVAHVAETVLDLSLIHI